MPEDDEGESIDEFINGVTAGDISADAQHEWSFLFDTLIGAFRFLADAAPPPASTTRSAVVVLAQVLAGVSFSLANPFLLMNTSPRTSSTTGGFPYSFKGRLRMVFRLPVMSSPVTPSPRVAPTASTPFS